MGVALLVLFPSCTRMLPDAWRLTNVEEIANRRGRLDG